MDLSETPLSVRFDGDESNLPETVEFDGKESGSSRMASSGNNDQKTSRNDPAEAMASSGGDGFNWLLWIGLPLGLVVACAVAYFVVRFLRRFAGLPASPLSPPRRRPQVADEEGDRIPAVLDLTFPGLAGGEEKVWQVGELVSLQCILTRESGEPVSRAAVEVDWGGSGEPAVLTTDRRGRCTADWSLNVVGTYTVTVHFAGDESHLPVTVTDEFRLREPIPGHLMATHIEIVFLKPADDLPNIWGIGERVNVEITLTDMLGESVSGGQVTATMGELGQAAELVTSTEGRCSTAWTGTVPGTYRVDAHFAGDDHYAPTSTLADFEVVDFREEVVRRYNTFLPWVREIEPRISDEATPREMEVIVVTSGMPIDQRALEVMIARFEEADYSLHEIDRPRFEAMYRARRAIVGD